MWIKRDENYVIIADHFPFVVIARRKTNLLKVEVISSDEFVLEIE